MYKDDPTSGSADHGCPSVICHLCFRTADSSIHTNNVKTPSFPGIYCFSRKISAFSLFFIRIGYIRARVVLAACAVAQPCAISFSYRRESPTSLACCFVFKYKTGPTAEEADITATSYNGFISFQSHARRSNQVSPCVASGRKNAT